MVLTLSFENNYALSYYGKAKKNRLHISLSVDYMKLKKMFCQIFSFAFASFFDSEKQYSIIQGKVQEESVNNTEKKT